jgi:cation transport ATPase
MTIAQIFFEQLSQIPDRTYDLQPNASFQNETTYRGLGNYKAEYEQQTKQYIEQEKENIERISEKIYANVLTIMGIITAIFAMITINFEAFAKANLDFKFIITMNLSLALCVVIMLGIILILINHARDKRFTAIYLVILAILSISVVLIA